jgi:hypothetical protein
MPISSFVLTFGAEDGIINRHGIQIIEHRDILQVLFEFSPPLGCLGTIDRFLEFTTRADKIFTIGPKEGFTAWTEHLGHHK